MDAIELTQELIRLNTVNPPGNESRCAQLLAGILSGAGFRTSLVPLDADRENLIATLPGGGAPLLLSGHLDTVPTGNAPWTHGAHSAEIHQGRLYGRGASDMKAGVAAIVVAALSFARRNLERGLTLVFTAGEETGCLGACGLMRDHRALVGQASALLIGEPTGNIPALGHKGGIFMRATARGITAHSSMPERGDNAIYKAAAAISRIQQHSFGALEHAFLGRPTINVGMMSGGMNANSVPDHAEFSVDIRTVAGMQHSDVIASLGRYLGDQIRLDPYVDLPPVATDPADPFARCVIGVMEQLLGERPVPRALPFLSDASVFTPALSVPTVVLGPGETALAHQTDEYCEVAKIDMAVEAYRRIIEAWCLSTNR